MEWTSFAPDVCKVDATTGKIEGVSVGDKLKIQLKVSGDGFEDVFAYLLVSVDDPAKYRVKAPGSGVTYSPMTPFFNWGQYPRRDSRRMELHRPRHGSRVERGTHLWR